MGDATTKVNRGLMCISIKLIALQHVSEVLLSKQTWIQRVENQNLN